MLELLIQRAPGAELGSPRPEGTLGRLFVPFHTSHCHRTNPLLLQQGSPHHPGALCDFHALAGDTCPWTEFWEQVSKPFRALSGEKFISLFLDP